MMICSLIRHPPPSQGNVATRRLGTRPSDSASVSESQCQPPVMLPLCWCHEISPPVEGIPKRCHFDDVGTGLKSSHAFDTSSENKSLCNWLKFVRWLKNKNWIQYGSRWEWPPPYTGDQCYVLMRLLWKCQRFHHVILRYSFNQENLKFHVIPQWSFNREIWNRNFTSIFDDHSIGKIKIEISRHSSMIIQSENCRHNSHVNVSPSLSVCRLSRFRSS